MVFPHRALYLVNLEKPDTREGFGTPTKLFLTKIFAIFWIAQSNCSYNMDCTIQN